MRRDRRAWIQIVIAVVLAIGSVNFGSNTMAASIYESAVLADGPVAYYRLGETTGPTAANSSANLGLDGSYVNFGAAQASPSTPSTMGEPGPRPGNLSGSNLIQGLESDNLGIKSGANANAHVEVADNPLLDVAGGLTLEAWVYRNDLPQAVNGNNEGIVGKFVGSGNQRSYALYYNSRATGTGALSLGFTINTTGALAGNVDFFPNVDLPAGSASGWTHLVAVYDPGVRMSIYMNGVLLGSRTTGLPAMATPIWNGTAPLWIGRQFANNNGNLSFEGSIDEVAIYGKVLSADQIAAHYQAAVPEPSGGLLALFGVMALICSWRQPGRNV